MDALRSLPASLPQALKNSTVSRRFGGKEQTKFARSPCGNPLHGVPQRGEGLTRSGWKVHPSFTDSSVCVAGQSSVKICNKNKIKCLKSHKTSKSPSLAYLVSP